MKTMHASMQRIRDLASRDGIPQQHYGEKLDKIRAEANDALIEADGIEDLAGDTWGGGDCEIAGVNFGDVGHISEALRTAARRIAARQGRRAGE